MIRITQRKIVSHEIFQRCPECFSVHSSVSMLWSFLWSLSLSRSPFLFSYTMCQKHFV